MKNVRECLSLIPTPTDEPTPCPFCGSPAQFDYDEWDPETETGDDGGGAVRCTNFNCEAAISGDFVECIKRWNRRSMPWAVDTLMALTDEQRMEVFGRFCQGCGTDDPDCYCMRDE